jgi:protein-S-isoprenylcysteine O-methyltransferase Ste14
MSVSGGVEMSVETTARLRNFSRTKAYDLLAAAPLIAWYLLGLHKQAPLTLIRVNEIRSGAIPLLDALQLIALAASFVLTFMLIYALIARKTPTSKTKGILPRAVALCGTFLGNAFLFLTAVQLPLAMQILADLFIIAGVLGSMFAISQLGGAFSLMPEARKLVTSGPYARVRHPLYLAEMTGVVGLMLQFQQPWRSCSASRCSASNIGARFSRTRPGTNISGLCRLPAAHMAANSIRTIGPFVF